MHACMGSSCIYHKISTHAVSACAQTESIMLYNYMHVYMVRHIEILSLHFLYI